ncbi:iron(III) transport system substrate-binding protein [Blastococcus sp. DSM 46786]|uniref:ABC transporter substrate-binding protein n=1 Tax=Blastococcus sp. DSM 46786 TaxID=1798227 RepID=UPI0008B790E3|nr:extracellular solute-binding protein [Blastococcus sp. DSM 46786]SEK92064.1 iron(III) transport system substrate-binding protein [Blastococcus sp. DSM 46786]
MRNRPLVPLVSLAAVALMTSACGGSPTATAEGGGGGRDSSAEAVAAAETYDRLNGLSGQERTDELVACAEEEGELNVYTSNTDMEKLIDGFTDEYDIEVNNYRANSESVLQRILQEDEAGYYGADVLETNALELGVASDEGLLHPYESELRDSVREEGREDENWTATRFNAFVVGWNTDLVPPGEEPTSFEELAEPQWKGKVSLEVGDVDWFTALHDYYVEEQGMSEDEFTEFMTRLASNSQVAKGHTTQGELLSAGQFAVTASSYSHTIDKAAAGGAPVAWRPANGEPVQPIVVRPNGIGLVKTATNPCAATLFVDYELTGGQEVFAEAFRIGAIEGGEDPLEGLEVFPVPEEKLLEDPDTWNKAYEDVVANGQALD